MTEIRDSEPDYTKAKDRSAYPWYVKDIDKHLDGEIQELLETYSQIPRDQQSEHVHTIRDQAYDIRAYMCTGLGVWLKPYISHSPAFHHIIQRLKAGSTMMDVGCFLGGDFRRLVFEGVPSDNMYGVDIANHWDLGFDLFHDKGRFNGHFIEADFLSEDNPELVALDGKIEIISISAVLHQWPLDKQMEGVKRLIKFSTGKGAIVVGHQIGQANAGTVTMAGMSAYRHNPESFAKMWDDVGKETGTKWECTARLLTYEDLGWDRGDLGFMDPNDSPLDFVVKRID